MGKAIDLTGNIFGRLTVLERDYDYPIERNLKNSGAYWKCKCSCGNFKTVRGRDLRNNIIQSCGCLGKEIRLEKNHNRVENLIGQTFGKLTVIDKVIKEKNNQLRWLCLCSCGNIVTVAKRDLVTGHSKSCGCLKSERIQQLNFKDLTNQKFGKLIVLQYSGDSKWTCKCACGNIKDIKTHRLVSGETQSCGCWTKSHGEVKVEEWLKENQINYITEYRIILPEGPRRFDFAILNQKNEIIALIEYDGRQHFKNDCFFKDDLKKIQERDSQKNEWAKENNLPLLRIPYTKYNSICKILQNFFIEYEMKIENEEETV